MKYKLGNNEFKTKAEIKKYVRTNIDTHAVNEYIDLKTNLAIFAMDLIKHHPSYEQYNFFDVGTNIKLKIVIDDEDGFGTWKIFQFEWKDGTENECWAFSTGKCINNL